MSKHKSPKKTPDAASQAERALGWAMKNTGRPMQEDPEFSDDTSELPELDEIESPGGMIDMVFAKMIGEIDELRNTVILLQGKVDHLTSVISKTAWTEEDVDMNDEMADNVGGGEKVVKRTQKEGSGFGFVVRNTELGVDGDE